MQKEVEILKSIFYDLRIKNIKSSISSRNLINNLGIKDIQRDISSILQNRILNYSQNEIENLVKAKIKNNFNDSEEDVLWPYDLLNKESESFLENLSGKIYVKFDKLLVWREVSHYIDQDIFITSFLANQDIHRQIRRKDFNWDVTLKTDNDRLHNMLQKGMAENHFHLNGSSPHFQLSWISLMNKIVGREKEFKESNMNKYPLEQKYEECIIEELVYEAAVIRLYLFNWIIEENRNYDNENFRDYKKEFKKNVFIFLGIKSANEKIKCNSQLHNIFKHKFQDEIDALRFMFAKKISYKGKEYIIDYAIDKSLSVDNKLSECLIGERYFLYTCMYKFFSNPQKYHEQKKLFHCYLIMKTRFRNEIIHSNKNVGFKNFSDYQDRKECFIENHPIFKDLIKSLAVLSSIKNQNIKSLEVRITPKKYKSEIAKKVREIDEIITEKVISDGRNMWVGSEIYDKKNNTEMKLDLKQKIKEKYFYVFHYPKRLDDNIALGHINNQLFYCRHSTLRDAMKINARGFVCFRDSFCNESYRVYGIDACANEIGCRPEVFAQAFRYMRSYISDIQSEQIFKIYNYRYDSLSGHALPKISITYHVGEDFLDIADGLRAIDEAILFLNMKHGDRLGHAIALGIDVDDWYDQKDNEVALPTMDILDNVAWLTMKLKQNNIENNYLYVNYLEPLFWKYYYKVYDNSIEESAVVTIQAYLDSWKLRGDNPNEYKYKTMKENIRHQTSTKININYWEKCSHNLEVDDTVRENKVACQLYRAYHFNKKVREQGAKTELFKIDYLYKEAVKKVQKSMQEEVAYKGLAIETNPSSNYLISNFRRYDKHPILSWYNRYLIQEEDKLRSCCQIPVCINTDDQGVFETLLENEYALMALALQKAKDKNGKPLYSPTMIYEWLDKVREMGITLSFINNNPNRRYY